MMSSRGMGCIERGPSKGKPTAFAKGGEVPELIRRKDAMEPVKVYAKGGETRSTPKNPSLWSSVKAEAKSKFDVYPSAYANAWAAKEYKKRGGSWGGADNRVKRG